MRVLEQALIDFAGCALVISHDRFFLDRICTHLLVFEGEGKLVWFNGNFNEIILFATTCIILQQCIKMMYHFAASWH